MSGMVGLVLSGLVAISKSLSEIVSKRNLNADIGYYTNAWALRFFALPLMAVGLLVFGLPNTIEQDFFIALFVSGPISIIASVLYMRGLQLSDLSIISPLSALSPLLLLITTPILVNELPSLLGFFGVVIVTFGVYILDIGKAGDGVLEPFKAIANEPGAKYIVGMLLLYSISAPMDKIGLEASSAIFYTSSLHMFSVLGLTPLVYFFGTDSLRDLTNTDISSVATIGLLSGAASILQMFAYGYTLVIYVSAIKRAGIIISVLSGGLFFDEPYTSQRAIGTCIIISGLLLIAISLS